MGSLFILILRSHNGSSYNLSFARSVCLCQRCQQEQEQGRRLHPRDRVSAATRRLLLRQGPLYPLISHGTDGLQCNRSEPSSSPWDLKEWFSNPTEKHTRSVSQKCQGIFRGIFLGILNCFVAKSALLSRGEQREAGFCPRSFSLNEGSIAEAYLLNNRMERAFPGTKDQEETSQVQVPFAHLSSRGASAAHIPWIGVPV